ncbi:unnamed protein product [Zymoseptoria tritici ST99CH_1E4]|uniref:Seipin n=1 Tax=Zymoseptoria tritici ST99CH_1E4 TaxID=1276532 RepID=A0A2H1FX00_ZYMTR|nr:unnamed protein product [Zymoseptoria tritici ST99CH_1E4]
MALRKGKAMIEDDEEKEQHRSLIGAGVDLALRPVRPFLSRPAIRAYLTTILFALTAFLLLGLAITSYALFYWSYIPRIGFSRTVHLQFDHVLHRQHDPATINPFPHGTIKLTPDLVSAQGYDIMVEMTLPHTPSNRDAGNFMLEAKLYASEGIIPTVQANLAPETSPLPSTQALATSRRPALLPYRSRLVNLLQTVMELPYYVFNFRSETTTLKIPLFDRVSFPRGWRNTPSTMHLEVQSAHTLQISSATVHFRARFSGLRWLMYNHRIISALAFITTFWMTELLFAGLAYGALAMYASSASDKPVKAELKAEVDSKTARIKQEAEDDRPATLSDTERTFPTLSSQAPLHYTSPADMFVKQEPAEDLDVPEHVARAVEADDEDEDEDEAFDFRDSGIGTSLESSGGVGRKDSIRKRRGRTEVKE